jgi:hypothetical protein
VTALVVLAAVLAQAAPRPAGERTYDRLKPSLFTIEVHSGNQGAKSSLGSGYLVSDGGHVVTNYHVVGSYIEEPDRYSIRVRNAAGELPARLLRFDLVNDLALLEVDGVEAPPLPLAETLPPPGAAIVAFGNPQGLGLSLIEGIFNGFAEKGLVDRMLLSMPLNSGMSGGPILNESGEVIGTNVSIMWLSNSLSFGVPVTKVRPLLNAAPLEATKPALLEETRRQLRELETDTVARLEAGFDGDEEQPQVAIGGARSRRPPDVFECWDDSDVHEKEGITRSWHQCNLQFTPTIEGVGPVASVELFVQHTQSQRSAYGFYGTLGHQAAGRSGVMPVAPDDEVRSSPHCVAGRVSFTSSVWKINTCVHAYVEHPGFSDLELLAVSVSKPREAVLVSLKMQGFRLESFEALTRRFLEGVQPSGAP